MKITVYYIAAIFLLAGVIFAWMIFGNATTFEQKSKYLFVREGPDVRQQVKEQFDTGNVIRFKTVFYFVASQAKIWEGLRPGRFEIKKGESIYDISRTLRHNVQSPVRFTINKLRTREDLARQIGKSFSTDSLTAIHFLNNNDSLKTIDADTNSLFTYVIPDTYLIRWNDSTKEILNRLKGESENFWNRKDRLQKTFEAGLTPEQVYIIASIVEEETNKNDEKGNMASVYINRLNKGMPLGADPTIKFALKDFSIKRILYEHLKIESPYNTYRNRGLPPGPVCTPSQATIDAVINSPKTDYLYFVAKSDFSGYHHFSNNFAEHQQYARQYQKALNELIASKQVIVTP